jgi:hypothetical protein
VDTRIATLDIDRAKTGNPEFEIESHVGLEVGFEGLEARF